MANEFKIQIHPLFDHLLATISARPDAVIGFSLASPPTLGEFIADLDPEMSLDWNNRDFMGLPELRSHVLRQCGLDASLSIDQVLITAGAAEANYLAIRQQVGPGREIITDTPGWPQAAVLAKGIGADLKLIERRGATDWALPLDELAEKISSRTSMLFLSNPNNPTGRLISEQELHDIVSLARPHGTFVVVDEVYAGLEWSGRRMPSIAGLYERGITTGSISKALGLQGLRTGWLISPHAGVVHDALVLRENSSEIMNVMGEAIAEIALRPERYHRAIEVARADGLANLDFLDAFIETNDRLSWRRPEAGLIGLARLADGFDADELSRRLLGEPYKTFLIPGSVYDVPDHIRVGVGGGPGVNLADGLQRLAACLDSMA